MNAYTAKQVLLGHRPQVPEPADPEIQAALELAARDPDLQGWLEGTLRQQRAVRAQLRSIAVPPGLGKQILEAEGLRRRVVHLRQWRLRLAACAAVAVLAVTLFLWFENRSRDPFVSYRDRMVRTALRDYRMQMESGDLGQIRRYLQEHSGHAGLVLEGGLKALQPIGCAVLRWNDRPVSLVCFDAPARGTVYLFVSKSSEIRGSPAGPDPLFSQVNKMSTASWTAGGDTYLLAVRGDESFLHRQLGR